MNRVYPPAENSGQGELVTLVLLIARGVFLSVLLSALLLAVITLLVYMGPVPEFTVFYAIIAAALFCVVAGAYYVGRKVEERGWLRGGLTGLLYVCTLLILGSLLVPDFSAGLHIINKLFLAFFFGVAGGILGINA